MSEVNLQSPWVTFTEEVKELFKNDPEIKYEYDGQYDIKLYVDNAEKAEALSKLIPPLKVFGNITVKITVIPPDSDDTESIGDLFEKAFEGNSAFSFVASQEDPAAGPVATYVVFAPEVVQFYNDDLSDYYRNKTTLYQNIARNVFGDREVYFCTDAIDKEESDESEEDLKEFTADE